MKKAFIILSFAGLLLGTAACDNAQKTETKDAAKPKGKYYCTMHPEVTADKPGTCSKCGMDLVERDEAKK
ncbi:heavy metal-binding domain-containing protein [Mucilaginibacter phyllosphaerae]